MRKDNANRMSLVHPKRTSVGICDRRATENDSEMLVEDDVEYKYYLDILADCICCVSDDNLGRSDVDNNIKHNSINDDIEDSQSKMLLEILRENGNSYVLDFVVDNQLQHVRYKKEGLCDELKSDTQKMSKDFKCKRKNINLGTMGSDPKRRKTGSIMETAKTLDARSDVPGKEGKNLLVEQSLQVSDVSCVAKKKSKSVVECDPSDENYLAFLDSDKKPRSHVSSVAKKSNNDVECDSAEDYRQLLDCGMVGDGTLVERKCEESNSGRENIGSRTESGNNLKSDMADDGSFICIPKKGTERKFEGSDLGGEKIGSPTIFEKNLKPEKDVGAKEGKFSILGQNLQVSDWVNLPSNNRPCLDISSVAKHKCHREVQCDAVDDDYQEFLSSTKIYEEDDCSYSDSELVIMESDPYHENTPFISSKTYDSSWFVDEGNHGESWLLSATRDSQFRKGLMEFLERPYEQGEYERYWEEISCRKQKERDRETRSGKIESCPTVGVNKSYLKLHKDLKEAIDGAKEQHKVLFLLRGFFYWLEHLTQEGSFQPWLDASCLEMLAKM